MKINKDISASAIEVELSARLKQYRIEYPMTRNELADKSMVSLGTIARFENGKDIGFVNVIRLLKALDLEEHLELIVPDPTERPSYHLENKNPKKRASTRNKKTPNWKWGDEN